MKLVRGVCLALQWEFTESRLAEIDECIDFFIDYCKAQRDAMCLSLSVFRPVMHQLTHVVWMIREMGPIVAYSSRSQERLVIYTCYVYHTHPVTYITTSSILQKHWKVWWFDNWQVKDRQAIFQLDWNCCNQKPAEKDLRLKWVPPRHSTAAICIHHIPQSSRISNKLTVVGTWSRRDKFGSSFWLRWYWSCWTPWCSNCKIQACFVEILL